MTVAMIMIIRHIHINIWKQVLYGINNYATGHHETKICDSDTTTQHHSTDTLNLQYPRVHVISQPSLPQPSTLYIWDSIAYSYFIEQQIGSIKSNIQMCKNCGAAKKQKVSLFIFSSKQPQINITIPHLFPFIPDWYQQYLTRSVWV